MFTNNRTFGDQLGINSQGNPTTPALRNSESQAKIFNEKLLPKNIKFSKSRWDESNIPYPADQNKRSLRSSSSLRISISFSTEY